MTDAASDDASPGEARPEDPFSVEALPPGRRLADIEAEGWMPLHTRSLRLALAMRGGVSLAVWIGGAVAEIDVLRSMRLYRREGEVRAFVLRADTAPLTPGLRERVALYARMLDANSFDRVEVDILAGASAGGLNSVIYAVAQRAGQPIDSLRETWTSVGGLADLMHPPGFRRVASLLRGDEYFWPAVREALMRFHTEPGFHEDLIPGRITVDLSATLIDSEDAPDADTREGRGDFHFESLDNAMYDSHLDKVTLSAAEMTIGVSNRIPTRDPDRSTPHPEAVESLDRLAYAARTTSSFPGAFEPATIYSSTGDAEIEPTPRPNMRFAFGAHRESDDTPYRVIDGGVFDNIPITRALSAVRTRASLTPSQRMLLYLDPAPALDPPVRALYDEGRSQFTSAVLGAVSRRFRRESEGSEVEELDRFVEDVGLATGRWESFATLSAVEWDDAARRERASAYIRYRLSSDLNLLCDVLALPSRFQLQSRSAVRSVWPGIDRMTLQALRDGAMFRYNELSWSSDPAARAAVLRGPQALHDAALCVLSAIQWIEAQSLWSGLPVWAPDESQLLSSARETTYDVLEATTIFRDRALTRVLDVAEQAADPAHPGRDITYEVVAAWLAPSGEAEEGFLEEGFLRLENAWERLRGPFARISAIAASAAPGAVDEARRTWSRSPDGPRRPDEGFVGLLWSECPWRRLLDDGGDGLPPVSAADLPPLFAATGMPPVITTAGYWRIDGHSRAADARGSSLEGTLRHLRRVDIAQRARAALGDPALTQNRAYDYLTVGADVIPARTKLAGTKVANFSGFLSGTWRENDWWWGRLDAAAGLARSMRSEDAARLQDAIVRDLVASDPAPDAPHVPDAAAGLVGGLDAIGSLDPDYTVGLASRGIRVMSRALPRLSSLAADALIRVLSWGLRPLTILPPVVLDRARVGFIGTALIVLTTALSWPSEPFPTSAGPLWMPDLIWLAAAAIAVAFAVRGMAVTGGRWRMLRAAAPDVDLEEVHRAAMRRGWLVATGSFAALVPLAIALRAGMWVPAVAWAGVSVACAVLAGRLARRVRRVRPARRRARWIPAGVAAVALGASVVVGAAGLAGASWASVPAAGGPLWVSLWVSAAAVVVAWAVLWGWQRWWFAIAVSVAATAAGWAAAGVVVWLGAPSFGPIAWLVASVAWGNAVWLAPETGWGSRKVDDRPLRGR